eukprot:5486353-Pyramimonas_sp.AAC.1
MHKPVRTSRRVPTLEGRSAASLETSRMVHPGLVDSSSITFSRALLVLELASSACIRAQCAPS